MTQYPVPQDIVAIYSPNTVFTGEHMNPSEAFHIQHLAELANAGVNIHQLEIMIDLPDGIINFSEADDVATEILAHQSDAKFLLRVGFKAGNKFADKYPNDVVKFEDGEKTAYWTQPTQAYHPQDNPEPRYSLASHKFERKAAEGLVNLAEALSTKPYKDSVIGAIIGAGTCSQWLWWGDFDYENHCIDFSDVMLERFKEYLQEKYVTVDALRTAWNNSSVTFDTITIPTKAERGSDMPNSLNDIPPVQYDEGQFGYFRNPGVGNNQRVVDYYISMSRELGRRMIYLCETFKKATDKKLLVGAFYGPTAILGYKIEGQSYFDEVLASEWIDFWLDPWSYQGRWEGEPLFINAPMGSLLLHNKTYLIEADLRTSELGRREFGAPKDAWGDLMMFRKSFIRSVTNGAYSYWFEMEFDGWFENDKIFQGIDEASKISTLAMSLDRTRNTEIAVIYDGASLLYASDWLDYIALVRQTIQGLGYMGADYETFSTMDISNPIMSNYKFFIFPNAFALSQSTRDAIDTYLKRDGNVILWVYAPGLINTDSSTLSVANMSSLTGMSFNYLTGRRDIAMEVTQAGDITENLPIGYEFGDFLRPTTSHNYPPENPYLAAPIQTYPQFYVEDVSADTFAIFSDTGKSGLAVKEFNDWTSVYCGTIAVPSSILRNIAKKAGVHLYTDTDDIINTNNSFLGMHTATEGAKQIRLPARMDVYDMFSKRLMGKDIDRFDVSVPIHSSILFFTGDYDAALGILGPPSETGNKLDISATAGGSVEAPGEGEFYYYETNQQVNLVAEAADGYYFVNWTGDTDKIVNVNAASTTITMDGNYTITANFVQDNTHSLTVSTSTGGNVETPGLGVYYYNNGTEVNIKAVASAGYHFVKWTGNTGTIVNVDSAETKITMNGNYNITATFAKNTHTLTISSGTGGSISTPGAGTYQYDYGTVVPIKAVANTGYHFVAWTGDTGKIANVNSAETSITMNGNYTITATFAKNTHTLTISSGTSGSISTPGAGTYQYDYGTVVPIKAVANTGYHFVAWTGDTGKIANVNSAETTITMEGNYTITATFAKNAQTLTISSGTGGSISTPGAGTYQYDYGTVVPIKAVANTGYHFVAWTGDTGKIANVYSAETTITMEGNYSITATFEQDAPVQYTLTISSGTGGSISAPGSGTYQYDYGTVVPIKAIAAGGYNFDKWTGDTGKISNINSAETTITMEGDYNITATFASGLGYLIGHWNFESGLNVADLKEIFPNGTVVGGLTWDVSWQAALFNGTNSYIKIDVPENINLMDGCVIEARVYMTGGTWGQSILGGYFGAIGYNLCVPYFGYTKGPWATLNYSLPSNQWVTVKGVRYNGYLQVYINGALIAQMTDPNLTPQNPIIRRQFQIGGIPDWGSDWYFKGVYKMGKTIYF
ncbi:MAG: InlB B-repeat-containing protein [Candidatus Ratteibacteria bacterium]